MLLNCGAGEDSWESLGLQGDPTSPSWRKSPWIFIGRTDAEAEAPILWPPDVKNWLIGKDPAAGKDCGQEEKVAIEDEVVRWHHWLSGHILSKLWERVEDRGTWRAAVPGVTNSWTRLSDWQQQVSAKLSQTPKCLPSPTLRTTGEEKGKKPWKSTCFLELQPLSHR